MTPMRRARVPGSMLFTMAVLAGVVAPGANAEPAPIPTPVPVASQQVWGGCAEFDISADALPTAQCTTVSVPVDPAKPGGAQADLAVIRIPATGSRIGPLFVNPGGPGASAVDTVAGMGAGLAGSEISEHFDLIGVDPRGVGHSTPELRCRTDAGFDAWRREPMVDFSPAGVAAIEALYQQFANQCAAQMGTEFLANVGTANAADDLDTVRRILGDEQLNYLGFSYGTQIGTAYLERYGAHVRTMVLDGAIDPAVPPMEETIRQNAAFQTAFNTYAADCARSSDCPLGQDPTQWVSRYQTLVDPLVAAPGRTIDPRGLSHSDAIIGTGNALYSPRYWDFLTSGLLGLQRGADADDLLALADEYQGRNAQGHYTNRQDAFNAVRCADSPVPTDPAAWAAFDQKMRAAAPFLAYGSFTGFAPRDICAFWPVPPTSAPAPVAPEPLGKVLVVSTTRDPATPYQAGVDLARQLQAPLITFDGTQHTVVFNGQQCVDSATVRYFVDSAIPPANLLC
ncbi:alpha/beta hydrolase [Mycolicibacterium mengxianglii]|uniref:alpha/beta hydrolase n=1 Tax=Mycolicibacterium mengxianglii TaxID=2736649 RepID=UPI003556B014